MVVLGLEADYEIAISGSSRFGQVQRARDVDGDGLSDILIGDREVSGNAGRVALFLSSGILAQPTGSVISSYDYAWTGRSQEMVSEVILMPTIWMQTGW